MEECNLELLINMNLQNDLQSFGTVLAAVNKANGGIEGLDRVAECAYYQTMIATNPSVSSEVKDFIENQLLQCSHLH